MNSNVDFKGLVQWVRTNTNHTNNVFRNGVLEIELLEFESRIGHRFPDDFREIYKRHDGQDESAPALIDGHVFLSLEEIIKQWRYGKTCTKTGSLTA